MGAAKPQYSYEEFLNYVEAEDPQAHEPVFVISAAAELADMHPQTLRQYDRMGLVVPTRQGGGQRRYSAVDVLRLRRIQRLSRDGVSLEGIRRIVELEQEVENLRQVVGTLVDQVNLLQRTTDYSRTFTAGATGDVTTAFFTPRPAAESADAGTSDTADGDSPSQAARQVRARRALNSRLATQKVLMWRPRS